MREPRAPKLDTRRTEDFSAELRDRAREWIPSWALADGEGDFGRALLDIAARFNSEVAERLDRAGDKMRRGFLDWLGVRGKAARPASMPVVFKLADTARNTVVADAGARMQADAGGTPVVFETKTPVRIVPGTLETLVAVNAAEDAFYLSPPGISDLKIAEPVPTEWQLKTFAPAAATTLQLDPEGGLTAELILEAGGRHYRVTAADKDIVAIEPPLWSEVAEGTRVSKVSTFAPFSGAASNWQAHGLYLGDSDLLNIEAAASIAVIGAAPLNAGVSWQYWGKRDPGTDAGWQTLTVAPAAQQTLPGALVLLKPKGAMDQIEVGDRNSRWIRAFRETITGTNEPITADGFSIAINAGACKGPIPCPPDATAVSPAAEAMANTTPLVLDGVFFPLGKEPRQFDAFYLGSQEAFSKKGAKVHLCFELADPTFVALAAVTAGAYKDRALAGVAKDRALHLLSFEHGTRSVGKFLGRDPLQPPSPVFGGGAGEGNPVALDQGPWRLPIWSQPDAYFLVAVRAGDAIWIWREDPDLNRSGWVDFGSLPAAADAPLTASINGLVHLDATATVPAMLLALRDGDVFWRNWPGGAAWAELDVELASSPIIFAAIAPVLVEDATARLVTSVERGFVGISTAGKLYHISTTGTPLGTPTPILDPTSTEVFSTGFAPAAFHDGTDLFVYAVRTPAGAPQQLFEIDPANVLTPGTLDDGTELIGPLDLALRDGEIYVIAAAKDGASGQLVTWEPDSGDPPLSSPVAAGGSRVGGAPAVFDTFLAVPGTQADVLVAVFNPANRHSHSVTVETGVVVPDSTPTVAPNDVFVRWNGNVPTPKRVTQAGMTRAGETLYPIEAAFPPNATRLDAYRAADGFSGVAAAGKWELDASDLRTQQGSRLLINDKFYLVGPIDPGTPRTAALVPLDGGAMPPPTGAYATSIETGGRVAPIIRLDPASTGNWDADALDDTPLLFPAEPPENRERRATAFSLAVNNRPLVIALASEFDPPVAGAVDYILDAAIGEWKRTLGDTAKNPELSWEYWNGRGWWRLDLSKDTTLHFKQSGAVEFTVPSDLVSVDWSGKTNHWIRARLVGGDYGKETVTVTTTPVPNSTATQQTVERSLEGLRPPSVVTVHISYAICDGVIPAFALAQDNGTMRDQSDANRTPGAVVETFIPLSAMLARLAKGETVAHDAGKDCPHDCRCRKPKKDKAEPEKDDKLECPEDAGGAAANDGAGGSRSPRAVFIGLNASPSEAPVNVLLLVEETDHTAYAPMAIDALVADRFVPIVAQDATRALGESGVLSMSFTLAPTPRELFGRTLTWLRLSPTGANADNWKPVIRGAYLNAVWASATETLTRELVGSSNGGPHQTFRLQRPPVLHDTLDLRIREPLGEEERKRLVALDDRLVLSADPNLAGEWVLWKQVTDPGDEEHEARVYALDEAIGEIRFGDGLHGAIPPIGRDSIVAFRYQRTEIGAPGAVVVPANTITAHTVLNLVTPVESVEAVYAAEQAAGGAPPESDERVLRFGFARIRHRERVLTARDIEDLALQSSPEIVQARAFVRRAYVRLVVVMRGDDPRPTRAQVRELRRLLLESGPVGLAAPNALRIGGPEVKRLRIDLGLRVETLEHAGPLGELVKTKLRRFFNQATGGFDKDGWPLGASPSEDDIAFVLLDAPQLEGIGDVSLREISDGRDLPWPRTLKRNELAMLAADPFRLRFETAEVTV